MNYDYLREKYPEVITKNQLYQICHISKKKALWLLENSIIPCEDSGKKTRRFKIRLDDVIDFLQCLDRGELDDVIPHGIFSNGSTFVRAPQIYFDSTSLCDNILSNWSAAPDMLTSKQAEELCGYTNTTLNRWIQSGVIKSYTIRNIHFIPKGSLAQYPASQEGQRIIRKTTLHLQLLEEFREKQQQDIDYSQP